MRRTYRTPIIILLLLVGVFLLVKGVMYLRVKSLVDDFVAEASESVDITYDGISTEITGGAAVEGIRIRPLQLQQAVQIDRAYFSSDDPFALILGSDWKQDRPPEQMRFKLIGVRVALDDKVLEALRAQAGDVETSSADACNGDFNNLDPKLLGELGFDELRMDAYMEYAFDVPAETLAASMGFDLHNIQTVSMSVDLDGVLPEDLAGQQVTPPGMARAEMSVDVKRAFGDRYMKLCAERANVTVDEYRAQLLQRMNDDLRESGITLGAGLQKAMAEVYRDWGELRITLRPEEPLGPMHLFRLSPQNAVDLLGLSLRVNDSLVTDLSFDFDMQALMQRAQSQLGVAPAPETNLPRPEIPKRVRITRTYKNVAVESLAQHVNGVVKIKPVGQPLRTGYLVSVEGGEAQIRQRAHGGTFTSHVPINEIESLEVQITERELID